MFGGFDIQKFGAPGLVGFLLGLPALAIVRPETTGGKVLLMATVISITLVTTIAARRIAALMSSRSADKPDDE